jgi:hypothetical protein
MRKGKREFEASICFSLSLERHPCASLNHLSLVSDTFRLTKGPFTRGSPDHSYEEDRDLGGAGDDGTRSK